MGPANVLDSMEIEQPTLARLPTRAEWMRRESNEASLLDLLPMWGRPMSSRWSAAKSAARSLNRQQIVVEAGVGEA